MNESAFKSILDAFAATRTSLDWWLGFWTSLVILGVAFELVFIIWDHSERRSEWKEALMRATVPFPSKPKWLKLIFEMFSVVLVVIGIAGELRIDAKLGHLETNVQFAYDTQLGFLTQEAGDAATSAQNAKGDAKAAKDSSGIALRRADTASSKLTIVQEGVKTANASLSDIQARIAWRSISDEEKKELKYRLKPFQGERVTLTWETNDPEQNSFAPQLVAALRSAGLSVTPSPVAMIVFNQGASETLDMFMEASPRNPFASGLSAALVCSSVARNPIVLFPRGPYNSTVSLTLRPRNPTPRPSLLPLTCMFPQSNKP